MRRKFVAGNWKMHGNLAGNERLLTALRNALGQFEAADCAVCVPYPYLAQTAQLLHGTRIGWGAQNLSQHEQGAYTGEISAGMIQDFGCRYVIVGHSERRTLYGEPDGVIAAKVASALKAGLTPIFCVGETLGERDSGVTEQVVGRQLDAVTQHCGVEAYGQLVVAYEPVWAIGTGRTATPEQAQSVHAFIRGRVAAGNAEIARSLRIQYGGSVKAANAKDLFSQPDIDGGLIGGASLVAEDFIAIVRAAG